MLNGHPTLLGMALPMGKAVGSAVGSAGPSAVFGRLRREASEAEASAASAADDQEGGLSVPGATVLVMEELGAREKAILAMEARGWPAPGAKERAIRERLGLAPVRYYQLLNALLDDERAARHDPVTVNRLRRVREERRGER